MSRTLVIGSGNAKKVAELAELLAGLPWIVRGLADFPPIPEPEETGRTFEENAALKARYYSEALGLPCVADDSGLAVDALDGAPGVYSARYAGEPSDDARNNAKLLEALADVPSDQRTARFVCCAAVSLEIADMRVVRGEVEGRIALEGSGAHGFGYDPLFIPDGYDETFGVLDPAIKRRISHRARALVQVRAHLEALA